MSIGVGRVSGEGRRGWEQGNYGIGITLVNGKSLSGAFNPPRELANERTRRAQDQSITPAQRPQNPI